MGKQLLQEIAEKYGAFSKGNKRIADFITEHYEVAAFLTAAALGQKIGVSESTVVRFAASLGYRGYPDFQTHLRDLVKSSLTSAQRLEVANANLGETDVIDAAMTADIEMIRATRELISREAFSASVDALHNAKRIYVLGVRSCASLAGFAAFYLNLVYDEVRLVNTTSMSEIFEQLCRITQDDVCIAISFPRYSRQTVNALRYAAGQGAQVIAITDSEDSPLAPLATQLLLAKSNMVSFLDSLTAPLSLINALIAAAAQRKQDVVYKNLQKLEDIWGEYQVYQTQENTTESTETRST